MALVLSDVLDNMQEAMSLHNVDRRSIHHARNNSCNFYGLTVFVKLLSRADPVLTQLPQA